MEPYQERVVEEKQDLDQKIMRLEYFMALPEFPMVSGEEQDRMAWQLTLMKDYSTVLKERIASFSELDLKSRVGALEVDVASLLKRLDVWESDV